MKVRSYDWDKDFITSASRCLLGAPDRAAEVVSTISGEQARSLTARLNNLSVSHSVLSLVVAQLAVPGQLASVAGAIREGLIEGMREGSLLRGDEFELEALDAPGLPELCHTVSSYFRPEWSRVQEEISHPLHEYNAVWLEIEKCRDEYNRVFDAKYLDPISGHYVAPYSGTPQAGASGIGPHGYPNAPKGHADAFVSALTESTIVTSGFLYFISNEVVSQLTESDNYWLKRHIKSLRDLQRVMLLNNHVVHNIAAGPRFLTLKLFTDTAVNDGLVDIDASGAGIRLQIRKLHGPVESAAVKPKNCAGVRSLSDEMLAMEPLQTLTSTLSQNFGAEANRIRSFVDLVWATAVLAAPLSAWRAFGEQAPFLVR